MKDQNPTLTAIEAVQALINGKEIEIKHKSNKHWEEYNPLEFLGVVFINGEYDFRLSSIEFITIGDVTFPKPETVEPKFNQEYWFITDLSNATVKSDYWVGASREEELLKKGLVHLCEQNAIAHAEALIKLSGGVIE